MDVLLACSSMVEHSAVNRRVAGSSPAVPAIFILQENKALTSWGLGPPLRSGASPAVPAMKKLRPLGLYFFIVAQSGARTSKAGSPSQGDE